MLLSFASQVTSHKVDSQVQIFAQLEVSSPWGLLGLLHRDLFQCDTRSEEIDNSIKIPRDETSLINIYRTCRCV